MYTNVDITRIDTTPQFPLGAKYTSGSNAYRYVYYHAGDGSVTATAGGAAYYIVSGSTTVPSWSVTMDYDSATAVVASVNRVVGFFCSALTNGTYGWIQTAGISDNAVTTDGNVDAGETIVAYAGNGVVTGIAAGSNLTGRPLGVALAADVSTTLAAGGMLIMLDSPCA